MISIAAPPVTDPRAPWPLYPCAIKTEDYRRAIADLCVFFCGDELGHPQFAGKEPGAPQRPAFGDPVYEWVTYDLQERAKREGWFYSSCAYLIHAVLECMGWEFPWLGRGEYKNPRRQPIQRINQLASVALRRLTADEPTVTFSSWDLRCGDVIQIGNTDRTTHVLFVLDYDPASQVIRTAEYGQPGGALFEHRVTMRKLYPNTVALVVGKRPVMRHLSIATLKLTTKLALIPEPVVDHWLAEAA